MRRHATTLLAPQQQQQQQLQQQQQRQQPDIEQPITHITSSQQPQHEYSTFHHESIRRRLFQSPTKGFSNGVTAAMSSSWNESSSLSSAAAGGSLRISRGLLVGIACAGICFLIAVHIYLFRVLLLMQGDGNWATTDGEIGPITPGLQAPVSNTTDTTFSVRAPIDGGFPMHERRLTPLRPIDYEYYTIRINTWRRPEQLLASVAHHSSCPGVKQIQIVWCDKENEPPTELLDKFDKVVVEVHEGNSLNERFNVLQPAPTLGILSIDDDVMRPCDAIDSGFFKWAKSPHRMVGFDARTHVENDDGTWGYGYLSTTEKSNEYSMSLTRYCFIHQDYMDQYVTDLPKGILEFVAQNFNCEDIAMSFMISSLTGGQPPLLADWWAMRSLLKLQVANSISGSNNHKSLRDECIDSFASLLGLKDDKGSRRLKISKFVHKKKTFFECGAAVDERMNDVYTKSRREIELEQRLKEWHSLHGQQLRNEIASLAVEAGFAAYEQGLIEKTSKWKERYAKQ